VPPRHRPSDQAVVNAFGQRVRQLRLAADLTQEALAEASGLHPTFISNVERGYRMPTLGTMLRLAEGLGVELAQLVAGLEEMLD
jgi:transcriptional regulator with XRE-family HTH domain